MTSTVKEFFPNTNVNEKVYIFSKSVLNLLSNFIPHKTLSCSDKDSLWFNSQIKSLLGLKNKVLKNYRMSKTSTQLLNK